MLPHVVNENELLASFGWQLITLEDTNKTLNESGLSWFTDSKEGDVCQEEKQN